MKMDKELKNEKMFQVLKTEQEKHPSPKQMVLANQWDSVESDTESLAQERAYRQQLQISIDQNKYTQPRMENADSLGHGDAEDDDANDDETEDLQVYDSIEVAAHHHARWSPDMTQSEYVNTQTDKGDGTSQLLSEDAYSDLHYDPRGSTNLEGGGCFNESPQISVKEYYQVPKEESKQAFGDGQGLPVKGEYRYIINTSPAVVVTHHMGDNQSDQPYHLHPQDGQSSSVMSPRCHNPALQLRSAEADLSRPSSIFTENENTSQGRLKKKFENGCDNAGENIIRSPEVAEDAHALHMRGLKNNCEREQRHTPTQTQHTSASTLSGPKILSNKNLKRVTEDIVERNKKTLGRNTSKCDSYATVHALKQDTPPNVNKVHETASTERQEDGSDRKKSQQVEVTQISKGKKSQRKEYPIPPHRQQAPAPEVRAEGEDCLSPTLVRLAAEAEPKPQKTTSLQPLPPTLHLNINLNTSSHLLPLLQQKGQDAVISVASLHGCPHWSPASEVELAFSPGYQQTNPGRSSQTLRRGVNAQLHHRDLESIPEQWQRVTALKWPSSCEGEYQKWSPREVHIEQFPQNLPRTPTTASSLGAGSYTLLPPIGKPTTGNKPELSLGQSASTAYPIHRRIFDGYLVQMEKQKQLRARVTYKAYSLKDYKQLKPDIDLRGLGPDYKATEKTKMKRQRLYSNVIREQNKKISRIPFLPAKDPEGNDKKVPRMKALEYAKTIARPPAQPQPKQRQKHQSEGFIDHASYTEGLDMSQTATLEVLRKRHEEEKKAVALLRKIHAV